MLLHWWTLNNTVADNCKSKNLINYNSAPFVSGKVTQYAGKAIKSSTSNFYAIPEIDEPHDFSVAMWVNVDSTLDTGYGSPFMIGYWYNDSWRDIRFGFDYYYADNRIAFGISNGIEYDVISRTDITLERSKWYHITAVYKYKKSISLYINGEKRAELETSIVPKLSGTDIYYCVGGNLGTKSGFDGLMNDVRVYDHALSQTEIKELAKGLACHFSFNFEDFYTPVEYLENDNNQYIDTNFVPDSNTEIEVKFKAESTENNGCFIFGAGGSDYLTDGFELYPWSNKWDFNFGSNVTFRPDATTDIVTFSFKNKQARISNSSTVVTYSNTTSPTKNLTLFGINRTTGLTTTGSCRIYYCKIWDNGELIHDYTPCVRNYDHKPGLYDFVENKFYTNANTSSQTDFKAPYYAAVEYIESDGNQYIDTGLTLGDNITQIEAHFYRKNTNKQILFGAYDRSSPGLYSYFDYKENDSTSYCKVAWGSKVITTSHSIAAEDTYASLKINGASFVYTINNSTNIKYRFR